jgi:hypothetical protein
MMEIVVHVENCLQVIPTLHFPDFYLPDLSADRIFMK